MLQPPFWRRLLLTCAQLVSALPFKKADEPLAAIVATNAIIAKRGDAVLAAFKAALKQTAGPSAGTEGAASPAAAAANGSAVAGAGSPAAEAAAVQQNGGASSGASGADLVAACDASLAVSMLLLLKSYLLAAYGLVPERVALFATASADKRKQVCFDLVLLALHACSRRSGSLLGQSNNNRYSAPLPLLCNLTMWHLHNVWEALQFLLPLQEEKVAVSCDRKAQNDLHRLRLDAAADVTHTGKQFMVGLPS